MHVSLPEYVPVDYAAMDISVGQKTSPYSKIVLVNAEGTRFESGTDDGITLTADMPWANQAMADSLLPKFSGRKYQSYTARDSFISPDASLGEMVKVAGVKSAILNMRTEFGKQMSSTVSAPGEEELDHEFEYVTKVDRDVQRQRSVFGGALAKVKEETDAKILENYNELIAALDKTDGALTDLRAGLANYVRYDLSNNEAFAGTKLFAQIGEKAKTEINAYVIQDGAGHAKSFLDLMADVIKLQGDTQILGNLTIESGRLKVAKSIFTDNAVWARTFHSSANEVYIGNYSVDITTSVAFASGGMTFAGNSYRPTEITSTTGEKTVLGQIRGA